MPDSVPEIVVVPYDSNWPSQFDRVFAYVWPVVADSAVRIDHIGSTSVPDLAAKPIIDMDIVIASEDVRSLLIDRLATIGYRWEGDLGVVGRDAFELVEDSDLPQHHLYLVIENNRAHLDHLLLRDLLREDVTARRRYEDRKRDSAEMAGGDLKRYTALKAAFVAEMLMRAREARGMAPVAYWQPTPDEINARW